MPSFGYGPRFSRRRGYHFSPPVQTLYGPNIGPKGPKKVIVAVWIQADIGYCYETNNVAEPLYAKWKARGVNTIKPGHPDAVREGRAAQVLASVKANNLMMIAAPKWEPEYGVRANPASLDYRSLATTDPYWLNNWIGYQISDEIDLGASPLSVYVGHINNMVLDGVTKPVFANFTRRVALPAVSAGSATINWYAAFSVPQIKALSIDTYEWHLTVTDAPSALPNRTTPEMWVSTWNGEGIYNTALAPPLNIATRSMFGRRFTASVTGLAVHLQRNGPLSRGRSLDGGATVEPPSSTQGDFLLPEALPYAPGDKATGHYIATGRVDYNVNYARGGRWQPGRYLRNEGWSGFVHGSCALYIFPQTVGQFNVTGYIDAVARTLVVTAPPPFFIAGALRVLQSGFTELGWIRRDTPQLSGTPGGAGTYALDQTKVAPVATGSAAAPVTLVLATEARTWGDDTNPENLAELTNLTANLARLQAHPTGGNLLIDPVNGGRRAFVTLRCPDIDGDASLYKADMTLAPSQAGYQANGTPILDSGGGQPLWFWQWPMGFEGFTVVGDDGANYIYVRSLSNSDRPTWFPGYAALGLAARVFGPFELAAFRRVGTGAAVEMTGTSGVLKAGVDDGAATWFWIETAAISQPEGSTGVTAYNIVVRRGGNVSGTGSVTASVSGTGNNPATAGDFQGGVFPSQALSFAANETSKTFTVNVNGDTTGEQNETFAVTLSSPSNGAQIVGSNRSTITCTIVNDDGAVPGAFVWLGQSLTGAPALPGSPVGAVHLNVTETANVTRSGITMRSVNVGPPANDGGGYAGVPQWQISNSFQGVRFELPAGVWEFAAIVSSASWGGGVSGTIIIKDDPAGANITRQTLTYSGTGGMLADTDNTAFPNAASAVADAVNALTYLPVTVSDLGGGTGVVQVYATGTNVSAIALRRT